MMNVEHNIIALYAKNYSRSYEFRQIICLLNKHSQNRDSKLRGTHLFSSSILIFFQYACLTVRPDFRLPIGIYIDKRVYSAIIVVKF